jgi:DNA-binding response OmpR family regulator
MPAERDPAAAPSTVRALPDRRPSARSLAAASQSAPERLVIIDDDSALVQVLVNRAEALGWQPQPLASPPAADDVASLRPSSVLLDVALLGEDRFEYLAQMAERLPECAVVVVSAPCTVAERIRGLRVGADDWITKPAHPEEVIARLQAIERRRVANRDRASEPIVAGELEVRPDHFQAYVADRSVGLTRREYELLELLAATEGRVLEREEIYSRVWRYSMPRGDRSVDVFVRKVRTKLRAASPDWRYVHTHFGVGYRFGVEPASAPDPDA